VRPIRTRADVEKMLVPEDSAECYEVDETPKSLPEPRMIYEMEDTSYSLGQQQQQSQVEDASHAE
jgi:hypothetical protein